MTDKTEHEDTEGHVQGHGGLPGGTRPREDEDTEGHVQGHGGLPGGTRP